MKRKESKGERKSPGKIFEDLIITAKYDGKKLVNFSKTKSLQRKNESDPQTKELSID